MDTVYLSGSEDVQRAGNRIKEAASEITQSASTIWDAMQLFREDVNRLEAMHPSPETGQPHCSHCGRGPS